MTTKEKQLQDELKELIIENPDYKTLRGTCVLSLENCPITDVDGDTYIRMKVEPRGTVRYEMVTNDGFLVEDMEYAPYEVLEQIAFEYERREKEKAREELVQTMLSVPCADETDKLQNYETYR